MRISAIQTYNPQIKNYKTKKQQRPNETRPNNQISFGTSVVSGAWLIGKTASETNKCYNLRKEVGKEHLVLDLSCRPKEEIYYIVTEIIKIAVNTKDGKTPLKNFL